MLANLEDITLRVAGVANPKTGSLPLFCKTLAAEAAT